MIKKLPQLILCLIFFLTVLTVNPDITHAKDIFSQLESKTTTSKNQQPLSESSATDYYMTMWITGGVNRALKFHQAMIPHFEKLTKHNELTNNGIKSVLKNIEDMGIKQDILSNKLSTIPYIGKNITLKERKVIDDILTWTFEVPVNIDFRNPSLRSQPHNKKSYIFLVRAIRSNAPQHKQHIALDHIEQIK